MFLSYVTIGYLKGPDIALVKDVETGTVAVRKKLRAELLGVYERLKSVEQANLPRVYETEEYEGECFAYYEYIEGETLEQAVDYAKSIYGTDDIIWYNEQGGRRPHAAASYAMLSGSRSAVLPNPYTAEEAAAAA